MCFRRFTGFAATIAAALIACPSPPLAEGAAPTPATVCPPKFGVPAALAIMTFNIPVVFAKAHWLVVYPQEVFGEDKPITTVCDRITDVVSAAIPNEFKYLLAEPGKVDAFLMGSDGLGIGGSLFTPELGAGDRIETIAVNAASQIEVVVSTGGDMAKPRFLLYPPDAIDGTKPIREFTSPRVTARVSAVAFDRRGEIYEYDDSGAIVEFSANASGTDPTPVRTIAGPMTQLRPSLRSRGSRPLTIDDEGNIVAADDRYVFTFAKDAAGDAEPIDVVTSNVDAVFGVAVDRRGLLYVLTGSADDAAFGGAARLLVFNSILGRSDGFEAATPLKSVAVPEN